MGVVALGLGKKRRDVTSQVVRPLPVLLGQRQGQRIVEGEELLLLLLLQPPLHQSPAAAGVLVAVGQGQGQGQ